jgi:hypothetical protein
MTQLLLHTHNISILTARTGYLSFTNLFRSTADFYPYVNTTDE